MIQSLRIFIDNILLTMPIFLDSPLWDSLFGPGGLLGPEDDGAEVGAGGYTTLTGLLEPSNGKVDAAFENYTQKIDTLGSSSFSIYQKVAVYVLAICILGSGITLLIKSGDAKKRGIAKDALILRLVVGVLIISCAGLVGLLYSIKLF